MQAHCKILYYKLHEHKLLHHFELLFNFVTVIAFVNFVLLPFLEINL